MSVTSCLHCDRAFDTASADHYKRLEPREAETTILYYCSAGCVAANAGLFDE